ncbi:MAG TPA: hypothetical protein VM677_19635 [Actinokineospora sp.]|nr:hypothetical protein [Actinokineospora sp.]
MTAQHMAFGTGAIGLALVEALRARGESGIRVVNRSRSAAVAIRRFAGTATQSLVFAGLWIAT